MNRMGPVTDALDHSGRSEQSSEFCLHNPLNPVILCDKYGSGTTALIVCLVLLLLGFDLEPITHDYMRSDAEMKAVREEWLMLLRSNRFGEEYADFTEDWVPAVESYFKNYVGAEIYLLNIGLTNGELSDVKIILENRDELLEKASLLLDI